LIANAGTDGEVTVHKSSREYEAIHADADAAPKVLPVLVNIAASGALYPAPRIQRRPGRAWN
jgi:hypothetical protein